MPTTAVFIQPVMVWAAVLWTATALQNPAAPSPAAGPTASQSIAPSDSPPAAPSSAPLTNVNAALDTLYLAGKDLTAFSASVALSEEDAAVGTTTTRRGTVAYSHPLDPGAATKMRVSFVTRQDEEHTPRKERKEYLLNGAWLTDRDYRTKVENRRQVLRPGEKINLLKLGEGPFPLPIGQDPAEVKKQFEVTPMPSELADDMPAIRLTPRPATKLARKFKVIEVWIDSKTGFPARIETMDANETTHRTTELTDLKLGQAAGDSEKAFELDQLPDGWTVSEEPFTDDK
jgi:hypothetical protein